LYEQDKLNQCGFIKDTNIIIEIMVARIWHGNTSVKKFDAYTDFLKQVAIPDYQKTMGILLHHDQKNDQKSRCSVQLNS